MDVCLIDAVRRPGAAVDRARLLVAELRAAKIDVEARYACSTSPRGSVCTPIGGLNSQTNYFIGEWDLQRRGLSADDGGEARITWPRSRPSCGWPPAASCRSLMLASCCCRCVPRRSGSWPKSRMHRGSPAAHRRLYVDVQQQTASRAAARDPRPRSRDHTMIAARTARRPWGGRTARVSVVGLLRLGEAAS